MASGGAAILPVTVSLSGINSELKSKLVAPAEKAAKQAGAAMQKGMSTGSDKALQAVEKAQYRVTKSSEELHDAQGRLSIQQGKAAAASKQLEAAESKLETLRSSGGATAEQLAKAEADVLKKRAGVETAAMSVEKAERGVEKAMTESARASESLAQRQDELAKATDGATESTSELGDAVGDAGDKSDEAGLSFDKFAVGIAAIGAAAGAALKGLYDIGAGFDDMYDTIRVGTGASGAAFDELSESAQKLANNVPAMDGGLAQIGSTLADLNTRLGYTGEPLEALTEQFLQLQNMGIDADINTVAGAFQQFGVEAEQAPEALDNLFRISQATGRTITELTDNLSKSGPALQKFGFGLDESAGLLGALDKAGLDSEKTLGSITKALGEFAKSGEDPQKALWGTIVEIDKLSKSGKNMEAIDLANKLFGAKGGAGFVAAVESGAFAYDDFLDSIGATDDTIVGIAEETADFAEQWQLVKQQALLALEPIATKVFDAMVPALEKAVDIVKDVGEKFDKLAGFIKDNRDVIEPLAVSVGILAGGYAALALQQKIVAAGGIIKAFKSLTVVTKLQAAAQAALNVVTAANQFVLLGIAIAAVVAGLVYFFTQTETGKRIWEKFTHKLKKGWDDFKEAFGEGVESIKEWWNGLTDDLKSAWESFKSFWSMDWLKEGFSKGVDKAKEKWANFTDDAKEKWSGFTDSTKEKWGRASSFLTDKAGELKDKFKEKLEPLTNFLEPIIEPWKSTFTTAMENIKAIVSGAIEVVKTYFGTAFEVVKAIFTGRWSDIGGIVSGGMDKIKSIISDTFGKVTENISTWATDALARFGGMWDSAKTKFHDGVEAIKAKIVEMVTDVVAKVEEWKNTFIEKTTAMVTLVVAKITELPGKVSAPLSRVVSIAKQKAQEWYSGVTSKVREMINKVISYLNELPGKVKSAFSNAGEWLKGAGKNIINGLWNGMKSAWSSVSDWIGGIRDKITGVFNDIGSIIPGVGNADGSVMADGAVKFFANGGENHVAQIARGGEWRVWAEPETQGESYIPHAKSKRRRSTQILAKTAEMFGLTLLDKGGLPISAPSLASVAPKSTAYFADGGVTAGDFDKFVRGGRVSGQKASGSLEGWTYENFPRDPNAWGDCSYTVGKVAALAAGINTSGRHFATGSQAAWMSSHGFKRGKGKAGDLRIGMRNGGPAGGHTSGTLPDGTNFEMGGARGNGQIGGRAAGAWDSYYNEFFYKTVKPEIPIDTSMTKMAATGADATLITGIDDSGAVAVSTSGESTKELVKLSPEEAAGRTAANWLGNRSILDVVAGGMFEILGLSGSLTEKLLTTKGSDLFPSGDSIITTKVVEQPKTNVAEKHANEIQDAALKSGSVDPRDPQLKIAATENVDLPKWGPEFFAREIARKAKSMGLDELAAKIGIATALVESGNPLKMWANRRVPESLKFRHDAIGSDHDSVGLFQQRDNGAWGTVKERMTPFDSAGMFFNKLKSFDYKSMDPGAAAQKVQVSAFPDRYGKQMSAAEKLLNSTRVYDQGGWLKPGEFAVNLSDKPEPVFSHNQWQDIKKDGARQGGVTLVVNLDGEEVLRKQVNAIEGRVEINETDIEKLKGRKLVAAASTRGGVL
ncbi:phage tail tape measure protein [Corynebacterium ulceribovis]|uniref:phage tail tape measure protein n=1 Tax=Corynebacterium ulceribovis TaxID=487732 RepID=UPI00036DCB76|nr:phage tail tape measure protein [Corynebacterium ulceribovis]